MTRVASTRFDATQFVSDFQQAWNAKDPQAFVSKYYAGNVEFTDPSGQPKRGADALRSTLEAWFSAFSEMSIKATQTIQSGEEVAILQRCKGRHTGELQIMPGERIPATNKTAEVDVAEFVRLDAQGKIVRDVAIMDSAQLLMQLGVLPGAAQDAASRRTVQR